MTEPQTSGADLARRALRQARADAKTRPTAVPKQPRQSNRPGDGRDPMPLGAALTRLLEDHAWEAPAAGGSVIEQWPAIAPELVGKIQPEHFDSQTGRLDLRPISPPFATQIRMFGQQMVARINEKMGRQVVRTVRALPPGPVSGHPEAPAAEPEKPRLVAAAEQAPRTRSAASEGFHVALAALESARPTDTDEPGREARDRWFGDIRGTLREPEPAAPPTALHRPSSVADDARTRALERLRAEKTGRPIPGVRRLGETA